MPVCGTLRPRRASESVFVLFVAFSSLDVAKMSIDEPGESSLVWEEGFVGARIEGARSR